MTATAAVLLSLLWAGAAAAVGRPAAWVDGFSTAPSGWQLQGGLAQVRRSPGQGRVWQVRAGASVARISHRLPARPWALSMDVLATKGSSLTIDLGAASVRPRPGRWTHLEAVGGSGRVTGALGGRPFELEGRAAARVQLWLTRGEARVDNALATSANDPAMLLLHRVASLERQLPRYAFLVGAERSGRLHVGKRSWTRGFMAGALWEASALLPRGNPIAAAALARTRAVLGGRVFDSHDEGFIQEGSSLAAYSARCRTAAARRRRGCRALRAAALEGANKLMRLAATNRAAATIPTRSARPSEWESDTIVDSMMNLPLLYWASGATGDPRYAELARRHAQRVAEVLVRPDGSTAQSVHFDRRSGALLQIHSHQGVGPDTTWARGQGWALYGFTTSAEALRDEGLLEVAERAAGYVADHLPESGLPPYDYSAPSQYPDTSAGVITAAGLFRLDQLCRGWPGACRQPVRWRPLAERLLGAALAHVRREPRVGFLDDQVGTFGGSVRWDDRAEFSYGLRYALEAIRRSHGRRLARL